jgi:hypothetical protein
MKFVSVAENIKVSELKSCAVSKIDFGNNGRIDDFSVLFAVSMALE